MLVRVCWDVRTEAFFPYTHKHNAHRGGAGGGGEMGLSLLVVFGKLLRIGEKVKIRCISTQASEEKHCRME